jgi:hypothetical protein
MPQVESKRRVTKMETILSKDPLDENDVGYQPPQPKEANVHKPNSDRNKKPKKNKRGPKKFNNFDEGTDGGKRRDND